MQSTPEQIVATHLENVRINATEEWAREKVLDRYEPVAVQTVKQIKNTEIARQLFDNIGEIWINPWRTGINYSAGKDGAFGKATFEVQATRGSRCFHHEFGHGVADAYGFGISVDAARETDIRYDTDETNFVEIDLSRDDIDEFKLTQKEGIDAPDEILRLVEAVNQAWIKIQRTVQEGGDPDEVVVYNNYGSITAHEVLAQLHEEMQTDKLPVRTHANFFHEHPELTAAYVAVFEPADRMKDLLTYLYNDNPENPAFDSDPYPTREPEE